MLYRLPLPLPTTNRRQVLRSDHKLGRARRALRRLGRVVVGRGSPLAHHIRLGIDFGRFRKHFVCFTSSSPRGSAGEEPPPLRAISLVGRLDGGEARFHRGLRLLVRCCCDYRMFLRHGVALMRALHGLVRI